MKDTTGHEDHNVGQGYATEVLPDVPSHAGLDHFPAGQVSDVPPPPAGPAAPPAIGDAPAPDQKMSDEDHDAVPPAPSPEGEPAVGAGEVAATPSLIMQGVLRVGVMTSPRETFQTLENPDLRVLLTTAQPTDTIIEAERGAEITIVDADVHHWPTPPTPEELDAYAAAIVPEPDARWHTHGSGLKLVYIGPHHRLRALAAALHVPPSLNVEILTHTRHPCSTSSDHAGGLCGPVAFGTADPTAPFAIRKIGRLTPELRQAAVQRLNMIVGNRYDHDRCPIDPGAATDAKECVVVLEGGVYCHRCAGHDVHYRQHPKPGFFPFGAAEDAPVTDFDRLARNWVHWIHAQLQLRHYYPNMAITILREIYDLTLREMHGKDDPRISAVFNEDLGFVWSSGGWIDVRKFGLTRVDNDAADGLPAVQTVRSVDGEPEITINRVRRSQFKHRSPWGYTPVRVIRGLSLSDDANSIPVLMRPEPHFPVEMLRNPLPEEQAFARLEICFPGLDRRYLVACLAAAICAEAAPGQPPMLVCTGPSGAAKEQTIRLAASFLADDITKLVIDDDLQYFFRQIGIALSAGHRFLVFDELGKTPQLVKKQHLLLQLGAYTNWRPLYLNEIVSTPTRAAIYFPCVSFPEFMTNNQEFCRRTRRVHLSHQVRDWRETSGGDTAAWRDRNATNAQVANSILTLTWRLCRDVNFRFF
jgi:hypothetical protein